MGRNTLSTVTIGRSEMDGLSLKDTKYGSMFNPMTVMVLEAICEFCKYAQVDTRQVEKKLRRYVMYRDYTGFSGFFVRYAKDSASVEMVEVFNRMTQEEAEELFVSLGEAFLVVPKELIYG